MNDRIRDLAEQAGINCVVPAVGTLEYSGKGEIEHLKKFAELIVRECAQVANDSNQSKNRAAGQSVGDVVRNHFGVE